MSDNGSTEGNIAPIRPLTVHPGVEEDLKTVEMIAESVDEMRRFLSAEARPNTQHWYLLKLQLERMLHDMKHLTEGFIGSYDPAERHRSV